MCCRHYSKFSRRLATGASGVSCSRVAPVCDGWVSFGLAAAHRAVRQNRWFYKVFEAGAKPSPHRAYADFTFKVKIAYLCVYLKPSMGQDRLARTTDGGQRTNGGRGRRTRADDVGNSIRPRPVARWIARAAPKGIAGIAPLARHHLAHRLAAFRTRRRTGRLHGGITRRKPRRA